MKTDDPIDARRHVVPPVMSENVGLKKNHSQQPPSSKLGDNKHQFAFNAEQLKWKKRSVSTLVDSNSALKNANIIDSPAVYKYNLEDNAKRRTVL